VLTVPNVAKAATKSSPIFESLRPSPHDTTISYSISQPHKGTNFYQQTPAHLGPQCAIHKKQVDLCLLITTSEQRQQRYNAPIRFPFPVLKNCLASHLVHSLNEGGTTGIAIYPVFHSLSRSLVSDGSKFYASS